MTGLETLRAKMIEKGATQTQVNSKAVLIALEALTDMGYSRVWDLERDIEKLNEDIKWAKRSLANAKASREEAEEATEQLYSEASEYINKFHKSLEAMETSEGRDRLRAAQIFVNTVDVDTKYDNTAFIVGLAALLSGVTVNAPEELKKINPRIPQLTFDSSKCLGRL